MQIKCSYCDGWIDDTMAKCPHCGGPNDKVVRTVKDQPLTIEDLQEWYRSKGLPPYETTRFFIGVDYRQPKAFGIYKEDMTGQYVVYKNLASGERKVRYKGLDQAYAVNEIFARLKEEIIQQKALNVKKNNGDPNNAPYRSYRNPTVQNNARNVQYPNSYYEARANNPYNSGSTAPRPKKKRGCGCGTIGLTILICFAVLFIAAGIDLFTTPPVGYYDIDGTVYYHQDVAKRDGWFAYDKVSDWEEVDFKALYPEIYKSRSKSEPYFISENYSANLACTNIKKSLNFSDTVKGSNVSTGYYKYDDKVYYHLYSDINSGWYVYDDADTSSSWKKTGYTDLPEDLQHSSLVSDFYYTPVWNTETQLSDFKDTSFYEDYIKSSSSGSDSGSRSSRWDWDYDDDDDDDDYSWSSYDSWDSGSTDWDSDW